MQKNQRSRDFTVTQQFSDSFLRNQRAGVPRFRTAPLEPVRENHLASRRVAHKVAVVANSRVLRSSPHDEPATFIARRGPQVHEYFRSGTWQFRRSGRCAGSGERNSAAAPQAIHRQFPRARTPTVALLVASRRGTPWTALEKAFSKNLLRNSTSTPSSGHPKTPSRPARTSELGPML